MPHRNHVAAWVDHLQARIFYVGLTESDFVVVHANLPTQHLHHKANTIGSGHVSDDPEFLTNVEKAIGSAEHILILGPSTEKAALKHYLEAKASSHTRAIDVESAEQMTDAEIVALARRHFRLHPTRHIS